MKAPKMKWVKFKKWTQIEDIAEMRGNQNAYDEV